MKETITKLWKTFSKWIIHWLWIVFVLWLVWYVYAVQVWTVTSGQTLTADMWNKMAGNYDYSTSEVNTWKKWIDNKPIYRKVVTFSGYNPWTATNSVDTTIPYDNPPTDVDTYIFIKQIGIDYNDMWWYASNSSQYRTSVIWAWYKIRSSTNHAWNVSWTVILEYTKTTD